MQSVEDLKITLRSIIGRASVYIMSQEIKNLADILPESERIIGACCGKERIRTPLIILTDKRLIRIGKDESKNIITQSYYIDKIEYASSTEKATKMSIAFNYESSEIGFDVNALKEGKQFIAHFGEFVLIKNKTAIQRQQKLEDRKLPRLKLKILNGHSKLKYYGSSFGLIQRDLGEVRFIVNKQEKDDIYYFMGFDRTENIKKSTLDVMGRAYWGRALGGKVGAMGAAVGAAAKGEDKSTAVLFLEEKATGKDIPLVIKCDSDTLATLSLFIPHAKEPDPQKESAPQTGSVASEIKEFKELLDVGAITQEEFDAKKKQLLGI